MATPEQVSAALTGGPLATRLVELGCDEQRVLRALSQAWGLEPATRALLATAQPARIDAETLEELALLPAVAVTSSGGALAVLVVDERGAEEVSLLPLPPHSLHLALEGDVRRLAGGQGWSAARRDAPADAPTHLQGWEPTGFEDSNIVELSHGRFVAGPEVTSIFTAPARVAESGAWGDLRKVSLVEIVQILLATHDDAIVDVTLHDGRAGQVALAGKRIVFAELGRHAGDEAFLRLAGERDGGFVVTMAAPQPGKNVRRATDALLEEASAIAARASTAHRPSPPPRPLRHEDTAVIDLGTSVEERKGQQVGPYEVLGDLGSGSTALVMRARHVESGEEVALKVLTKESVADAAFLRRFKREVRTHAVLKHPNILGVKDFGRVEGTYYLATEPMESTLESLSEGKALPAALVVRLVHDVLRGLSYAHDRGVVHRDLSPSNLMLSTGGQAKIADFGLARYELDPNKSSTGAIVGTPRYMSPEQALGADLDLRSDLFTLASVAHELLAGRPRFAGKTPAAVMLALSKGEHEPLFDLVPTIPRRLDDVIVKLGARDLAERYPTAHDALGDLAPLVLAVNLRYPTLVVDFLKDPKGTRERLFADQAGLEAKRGHALLARGDGARLEVSLCAARAKKLDKDNRDMRRLVDDLAAAGSPLAADVVDPELMDLDKRLREGKGAPADLLRRMAQLARARGDVLRTAQALLRLSRVAPGDAETEKQLAALFGDDARAPFEWSDRERPLRPAVPASSARRTTTSALDASAASSGGSLWLLFVIGALVLAAVVVLALRG